MPESLHLIFILRSWAHNGAQSTERSKNTDVINLIEKDQVEQREELWHLGRRMREWSHTSVSGFVAQQHLHLPVLLQRLQQDVALLVEEEEERQGDVIRVAAVPGHLKQGSRVTAAALIVVWTEKRGVKGGEWEMQFVD